MGVLTVGLAACDLFDPTNAENPNVSTDGFLDLENSVELWLDGMERQMTIAMNNDALDTGDGYITTAEIASDNYVNTKTFFKPKKTFWILRGKIEKFKIPRQQVVRTINFEHFLSITFSSVFKTVGVTALPVDLLSYDPFDL